MAIYAPSVPFQLSISINVIFTAISGGLEMSLESLRLPFIAHMSNRYVIIQHVIHPCFTLLLPFVAHVCMCRLLFRRLNFPQRFLRDSRFIYTFGKFILVKLVTSHCNLPFAICTINGNLKLSISHSGRHVLPQMSIEY